MEILRWAQRFVRQALQVLLEPADLQEQVTEGGHPVADSEFPDSNASAAVYCDVIELVYALQRKAVWRLLMEESRLTFCE